MRMIEDMTTDDFPRVWSSRPVVAVPPSAARAQNKRTTLPANSNNHLGSMLYSGLGRRFQHSSKHMTEENRK